MTLPELFARSWHVGLALTPLLIWAARRPCPGGASRQHALAVAVFAGLLVSVTAPALGDPGTWLATARQLFRDAGLAPCLPARPLPLDAPTPNCLAYGAATPWLVGVGVVLAWRATGWLRLERLRRAAVPVDVETLDATHRAARELGVVPPRRVAFVDSSFGPLVTGCCDRRRLLLLPTRTWARLDARERAAVLLHELAHLRRRDLATLEVGWLACVAFWWHPLVWHLRRRAASAAELATDALAVRTRPDLAADLARALLDVERGSTAPAPAASPAVGIESPAARELARRLRALVSPPPRSRGDRPHPVGVALAAFALTAICGWAVVQVAIGRAGDLAS